MLFENNVRQKQLKDKRQVKGRQNIHSKSSFDRPARAPEEDDVVATHVPGNVGRPVINSR